MKEKKGIPVVINLASLVSYDGMTDDPMQVLTTGTLIPQGNASLLRYTESQEDEATGEVTQSEIQLELKKNQVTMNRMGEFANTMLFMPNKRFETVLKTPFGELPMAVYSRDVRCDLGEDSGKVHLKYELSMQGAYASTNELHLEYWANTQ
ncbi:MAG: DUF1934 domain-containing protein [Clostridiales bacterium]|nr:DUF1934 domain-containing protein [Clostridiales bacterium]